MLTVIFDNGGGTALQTPTYVHYYDIPSQAARDAGEIMSGVDPGDWEGHEPECRLEYNHEIVANGGQMWCEYDGNVWDVQVGAIGWANADEFFGALSPYYSRILLRRLIEAAGSARKLSKMWPGLSQATIHDWRSGRCGIPGTAQYSLLYIAGQMGLKP